MAALGDWPGVVMVALFWAGCILILRWRRASRKAQIVVNLMCLGMFAINLLFQLEKLPGVRVPRAWQVLVWFGVLVGAAWGYYRKKLLRAYLVLAIGFSLVCLGWLFDWSTQSAIVYPLNAIGFVLMAISFLLTLRRTRGSTGTKGSHGRND